MIKRNNKDKIKYGQSGHYENDIYDNSSETEECAESVLKIDKF